MCLPFLMFCLLLLLSFAIRISKSVCSTPFVFTTLCLSVFCHRRVLWQISVIRLTDPLKWRQHKNQKQNNLYCMERLVSVCVCAVERPSRPLFIHKTDDRNARIFRQFCFIDSTGWYRSIIHVSLLLTLSPEFESVRLPMNVRTLDRWWVHWVPTFVKHFSRTCNVWLPAYSIIFHRIEFKWFLPNRIFRWCWIEEEEEKTWKSLSIFE